VRPNEVLVDIGLQSEGVIPKHEFLPIPTRWPSAARLKCSSQRSKRGWLVVLSHRKAEQKKLGLHRHRLPGSGTIEAASAQGQGGLTVQSASKRSYRPRQIDMMPRAPRRYLGKTFKFQVVKINQERGHRALAPRR